MSKELRVQDPWFDRRYNHFFLLQIQKGLVRWAGAAVRRYSVNPFDYSREEMLVSHLATAADRSNYYALQEYPILDRRADLVIRYGTEPREQCVFEVKRIDVRLKSWTPSGSMRKALDTLTGEWNKVSGYPPNIAGDRCALIGMPIYVESQGPLVGSTTRLPYWMQSRSGYYEALDGLYLRLADEVEMARRRSEATTSPNFFWGYALRYRLAKQVVEDEDRQEYVRLFLGMLWVGRNARTLSTSSHE